MIKSKLYNLFHTAHIQTNKYGFECIFDSEKIGRKDEQNTITHIIKPKDRIHYAPIIFEGGDRFLLDDYCLLLSVMQGNHIHYGNRYGLPNLNKVNDFDLFLSEEIGPFLDSANDTLDSFNKDSSPLLYIIGRAYLLYYEAKHILIYNESKNIVMMHLFEFLLSSIYRTDNNVNDDDDVRLEESFSHICKKYQYQKYIDDRLKEEIKPKKLSKFKKEKGIKSIHSFTDQFNRMRNRIQHGKQTEKPSFIGPSDSEFTFFYRLESLIRVILSDELGFNNYVRKFDILYQLILEMNVVPTLTPEFSKLKFIEKTKLK